jgi:hypothetical protein
MITNTVAAWHGLCALRAVLGWPLGLALTGAAVLAVSRHRRR